MESIRKIHGNWNTDSFPHTAVTIISSQNNTTQQPSCKTYTLNSTIDTNGNGHSPVETMTQPCAWDKKHVWNTNQDNTRHQKTLNRARLCTASKKHKTTWNMHEWTYAHPQTSKMQRNISSLIIKCVWLDIVKWVHAKDWFHLSVEHTTAWMLEVPQTALHPCCTLSIKKRPWSITAQTWNQWTQIKQTSNSPTHSLTHAPSLTHSRTHALAHTIVDWLTLTDWLPDYLGLSAELALFSPEVHDEQLRTHNDVHIRSTMSEFLNVLGNGWEHKQKTWMKATNNWHTKSWNLSFPPRCIDALLFPGASRKWIQTTSKRWWRHRSLNFSF